MNCLTLLFICSPALTSIPPNYFEVSGLKAQSLMDHYLLLVITGAFLSHRSQFATEIALKCLKPFLHNYHQLIFMLHWALQARRDLFLKTCMSSSNILPVPILMMHSVKVLCSLCLIDEKKLMFWTIRGEMGGKKWRAGCLSLAQYRCSLLEMSGDGKPSIICSAEPGAVLWIRHKSLMEQIRTAVQCPWKRGRKEGPSSCLLWVRHEHRH